MTHRKILSRMLLPLEPLKKNQIIFCLMLYLHKVNSVQEACAKCFLVHILKFVILQTTWKKQNKKHQNAKFIVEKLKTKELIL